MRDAQCNNDKLHTALYGECLRAMMFPGPPTRARNPYTRQRHPKGWRCFFAFIYCCPYLRLNSYTNINKYKIIDCLY